MICYTNHALDQFLESCVHECGLLDGVVRVGGRCRNPSLDKFLLSNLRSEIKSERSCDPRLYGQICDLRKTLNTMMKSIENHVERIQGLVKFKLKRILKFDNLRLGMDPRDLQEFQPDASKNRLFNIDPIEYEFLRWLGVFDQRNEEFISNYLVRSSEIKKDGHEQQRELRAAVLDSVQDLLLDRGAERPGQLLQRSEHLVLISRGFFGRPHLLTDIL